MKNPDACPGRRTRPGAFKGLVGVFTDRSRGTPHLAFLGEGKRDSAKGRHHRHQEDEELSFAVHAEMESTPGTGGHVLSGAWNRLRAPACNQRRN